MFRDQVHRFASRAPIAMSLMALAMVLFVLLTGFERGARDEGAAAHIFQLLILAQAPVMVVFLATANWSQPRRLVATLAAQVLALAAALGAVAAAGL